MAVPDPTTLDSGSADVIDLGHTLENGMPQSPRHPSFHHTLVRRHGDQFRDDGSSSANDLLTLGTHIGTHVDALGHFSLDGELHGGVSATESQLGSRLREHGVEQAPIFLQRGVLLDIPAALGVEYCEAGYEVSVADLKAAQRHADVEVRPTDVVLVATGWGRAFDAGTEEFLGWGTGVPGIGPEAGRWLANREVAAVGGETLALEHIPAGQGHAHLPVHGLFLVERGIYIFETMKLDVLQRAAWGEFLFVAVPLKIRGATGSPVRPLAVRASARSVER